MDLILLSGNSLTHKKWIEEVEEALRPLFTQTYIQYYLHWETGDEVIKMDYELETLENKISSYKNYLVFAKSAGTLLAARAAYENILQPDKCVFLGFPLLWARDKNFAINLWFKNFSIPTLFIQNSHDPFLSYENLLEYLKKEEFKNYQTIKLEGKTHDYSDFNKLKKLVKDFIS